MQPFLLTLRRPALALLAVFLAFPAQAGLIRDAEIETTLRDLSAPIFTAAGLEPEAVNLFIVEDPAINAYVAGGSNIFFHTGLLTAATTPEMLIGVIAHETGHIAGGHLARGSEQVARASVGAVISFILGAAAVAGGAGDAGAAILSAGPSAAERSLLAFTRGNEQAADQAALRYLDENGITSEGMLDMFERLRRDEKRYLGHADPYALTHPLTRERISHIRNHVQQSPLKDAMLSPELQRQHSRMVAKLEGFLNSPQQTLAKYADDRSVEGRYARAIAYFRESNLDQALPLIDSLLAEQPDDPYFHELKGQMLFENGQMAQARDSYEKASALLPTSPIIRAEYAKALLGTPTDDALTRKAIGLLERASRQDPTYGVSWRLLAEAYGKTGEPGKAHLALAEEAAMRDDPAAVRVQAELALDRLPTGSPAHVRAQDLKTFAIRREREKKDEGNGPFFSGQSSDFLSPSRLMHP